MRVRISTRLWLALASGLLLLAAPVVIAAQWTTNGNDVYKTNTTGNVGIGTETPQSHLDITQSYPSFRFVWTNAANYGGTSFWENSSFRGVVMQVGSAFADTGRRNNIEISNATTSGAISMWTNTIERVRIDPSGNVGIGTSDPTLGGLVGSRFTITQADAITGFSLGNTAGTPRFALNGNSNGTWTMYDYGSSAWTAGITQKSGNVGIGTLNPTALLSVSKNQASGTEIRIDNGNAAGFAGLYMNGGFAGTTGGFVQYNNVTGNRNLFVATAGSEPLYLGTENSVRVTVLPGSGNVGIGKTDPEYKLDVVGDIKASGTIHAKYQDLAEWVPSSEQLSAGTVVVLDTTKSNQVIASGTAYDTRVAGVISAQPGITLGESGEGKVLVATTGRVRVKVDASRGPIHIGDLLVTSDVAGVAMKSEAVEFAGRKMHMPGTIIGKALEPLAKGSGEILVLLSLQ